MNYKKIALVPLFLGLLGSICSCFPASSSNPTTNSITTSYPTSNPTTNQTTTSPSTSNPTTISSSSSTGVTVNITVEAVTLEPVGLFK